MKEEADVKKERRSSSCEERNKGRKEKALDSNAIIQATRSHDLCFMKLTFTVHLQNA